MQIQLTLKKIKENNTIKEKLIELKIIEEY